MLFLFSQFRLGFLSSLVLNNNCPGSGAVMRPDSFADISTIWIVWLLTYLHYHFYLLTYSLPYLSASLRSPFRFQTGCRIRWLILALVFAFIFRCSLFCYGCMFAFVVSDLVLAVVSREIGQKNISKWLVLCCVWRKTLTQFSVNTCSDREPLGQMAPVLYPSFHPPISLKALRETQGTDSYQR